MIELSMKLLVALILAIQSSANDPTVSPLIEMVLRRAFVIELKINDSQEDLIRSLKTDTREKLEFELGEDRRKEQMMRFQGLTYSDEVYNRRVAEIHRKANRKLAEVLTDDQQARIQQLARWNSYLISMVNRRQMVTEKFLRDDLEGDAQDLLLYQEYTKGGLELQPIEERHERELLKILERLESASGVTCRDIVSGELENETLDSPFLSVQPFYWLVNVQLDLARQGHDMQLFGDQMQRVRQVISNVESNSYADGEDRQQMSAASQEVREILGGKFYRRVKQRYLQQCFSGMNKYGVVDEHVAQALGCSEEELKEATSRLKEEKKAFRNERAKYLANYYSDLRDRLSGKAKENWDRLLGPPPIYLFGYAD